MQTDRIVAVDIIVRYTINGETIVNPFPVSYKESQKAIMGVLMILDEYHFHDCGVELSSGYYANAEKLYNLDQIKDFLITDIESLLDQEEESKLTF